MTATSATRSAALPIGIIGCGNIFPAYLKTLSRCLRVLNAGKHFFTEKPLAATFEQGLELVELARAKGLRVGCAPDTFLGAAGQALRALVDAGTVGAVPLGPRAGAQLPVAVPTHVVTQLAFASGAHIVLTSSFDVWRHNRQTGEFQRAPGGRPCTTNSRGIGLIDMALALQEDHPHRCSAEMALHVLEVMDRALDAGRTGQRIPLTTRCERPAPLAGKLF